MRAKWEYTQKASGDVGVGSHRDLCPKWDRALGQEWKPSLSPGFNNATWFLVTWRGASKKKKKKELKGNTDWPTVIQSWVSLRQRFTWGFLKNTNSRPPPQTYWIWNSGVGSGSLLFKERVILMLSTWRTGALMRLIRVLSRCVLHTSVSAVFYVN